MLRSEGRSGLRLTLRGDDLEDVAVGAAEKEPGKRGRPLRVDQRGAVAQKPALQFIEISLSERDRDVPSELRFERRRREVGDLDKMQLLARRDLQPCRRPADVVGT